MNTERFGSAAGILFLVVSALEAVACGGRGGGGSSLGSGGTQAGSAGDSGTAGTGAAGHNSSSAGASGATGTPSSSGPPPALNPRLVVLTYLGGAGDQYFQDASFDAAGNVVARAGALSVTYDVRSFTGTISGDVSTPMDLKQFPVNYPLPQGGLSTNRYQDTRNGQTYTWGTHPNVAHGGTACPAQCNGLCSPGQPVTALLQMAFVTSDKGWKLWDFAWNDCVDACEVADSRGYDLWPAADGKVGVMLWTDGGDTPLRHDPRDVSKPALFLDGAFGDSPGGRGVLFALIDPDTGSVPSGTFLNTHAIFHTHDDWGRVYLTKAIPMRYGNSQLPNPTNPWGQSTTSESGLFVLNPDYRQPAFHAYLGGDKSTCSDAGTATQLFDAIALRGNLLIMAGTTCVTDLATTPNAVQKVSGGGQDGLLAVIKLWD